MAAYISFQPSDYFNSLLYSGTGASNALTGVGFQPDFTWIKMTSGTHPHALFDSVRGVTKYLSSDATTAETTAAESLKSFDSTGFTLGTNTVVNGSGNDNVAYSWKAGTTTGIDTTGATITPSSYSFDQDRGQSIVAYTGNSTTGATLPHGLGATPDMYIIKTVNTAEGWVVYHKNMDATAPEDYFQYLNTTVARADDAGKWNDTAPTSTVVSFGGSSNVNTGYTYVGYFFKSIPGYSKFGGYEGNGNANGPFVYTGFRPNWLMVKSIDSADSWHIANVKSSPFNVSNKYILANSNAAQVTSTTTDLIDVLSNGFKPRASNAQVNGSHTYIYAAFAEFPFVSSNDVPGVAR